MSTPETTPTDAVWDISDPQREMFQRNGEYPDTVVLVASPQRSAQVNQSMVKFFNVLVTFLLEDNITLLFKDQVQLNNGEIIEIYEQTLLISVIYPTAVSKIMNLDIIDLKNTTIH